MKTSPGDLLPPAVNDTCELSDNTDFCQNAGEYIIILWLHQKKNASEYDITKWLQRTSLLATKICSHITLPV